MDHFVNSSLQGWRLETFDEGNGIRHHPSSSGSDYWKQTQMLGSGTFGDVWHEQCISGPSKNAVRAVKHIRKRNAAHLNTSHRELEALIIFSDPQVPEYQHHFVGCLGWFADDAHLYIAMEYIQHGDLQQYITAMKSIPEPEAAVITTQVARALQYMHQKNYVHRDLKPLNILVARPGPDWHVKLADFGIAKSTEGAILATHNIGTPGYMAPELLDDSTDAYTASVDVWALGAVVFCMRTSIPPFRSHSSLFEYARDHTRFPIRDLGASSGFCMNFVQATMADIPHRRLTIEKVLAHDWLVLSGQSGTTQRPHDDGQPSMNSNTWNGTHSNAWSNTYGGRTAIPQPQHARHSAPGTQTQTRVPAYMEETPQNYQRQMPPPPFAPAQQHGYSWETPAREPTTPYAPSAQSVPLRNTNNTSSQTNQFQAPPPHPYSLTPGHGPQNAHNDGNKTTIDFDQAANLGDPFLTCLTCNQSFFERGQLMSHVDVWNHKPKIVTSLKAVQAPHNDSFLGCQTCNRTFPTRSELISHVNVWDHVPLISTTEPQTRVPETQINVPGQSVGLSGRITNQTYHIEPPLWCGTCNKTFLTQEDLMSHINVWNHKARVGSPKPRHNNPRPEFGVPRLEKPKETSDAAQADPFLTCKTCNKSFKKREYLMGHVDLLRHEALVNTPRQEDAAAMPPVAQEAQEILSDPFLTCLTCSKAFKKREYLMGHVNLLGHEALANTPRQEEAASVPPAALEAQEAQEIPPEPFLTCLTCNTSFKERAYLMKHVNLWNHQPVVNRLGQRADVPDIPDEKIKHPSGGDPFLKCGTCQKTFSERGHLMGHVAKLGHEPQDDSYLTCLTCHGAFFTRDDLFSHIQVMGHARNTATNKPESYPRPPASRHGNDDDHEPAVDPFLTCTTCHQSFASRNDLFEHLEHMGHARDTTTGRPEFYRRPWQSRQRGAGIDPDLTCAVCHRTFVSRNDLFLHLRERGHMR